MKKFWFFISFSVLDKKAKKLYDSFCFYSITTNENEMELNENDFVECCKQKVNKDEIVLINNISSI